MRRALLVMVAAALVAGCGEEPEGIPVTTATVPAPTRTTAVPPPTETTAPGAGPGAPAVSLDAPGDGDQYLEGSDAPADFRCRRATSCEATVAKEGEAGTPIEDGDSLPTKPGTYTVTVVATGAGGQTARASATYEVPDVPGSGGGGTDTLPPGTPEGGP